MSQDGIYSKSKVRQDILEFAQVSLAKLSMNQDLQILSYGLVLSDSAHGFPLTHVGAKDKRWFKFWK